MNIWKKTILYAKLLVNINYYKYMALDTIDGLDSSTTSPINILDQASIDKHKSFFDKKISTDANIPQDQKETFFKQMQSQIPSLTKDATDDILIAFYDKEYKSFVANKTTVHNLKTESSKIDQKLLKMTSSEIAKDLRNKGGFLGNVFYSCRTFTEFSKHPLLVQ